MALDAWNYEIIGGLEEEVIMMHITHEEFQSYPEDSEDEEDDQICIICQESCVDGQHIGRIECDHTFHLECITKWLKQKNACPMCKITPALVVP